MTQRGVLRAGGCRVTPLKEALTALADVLAQLPAEEILFDWFRSGRLVGELSVLIKRRIPKCKPRLTAFTRSIWRSSAKGAVTRQRKTIDWKGHTVQHPPREVWATRASGWLAASEGLPYASAGRSLTRAFSDEIKSRPRSALMSPARSRERSECPQCDTPAFTLCFP